MDGRADTEGAYKEETAASKAGCVTKRIRYIRIPCALMNSNEFENCLCGGPRHQRAQSPAKQFKPTMQDADHTRSQISHLGSARISLVRSSVGGAGGGTALGNGCRPTRQRWESGGEGVLCGWGCCWVEWEIWGRSACQWGGVNQLEFWRERFNVIRVVKEKKPTGGACKWYGLGPGWVFTSQARVAAA